MQGAKTITIVADRESDIYDLLTAVDGEKMHLLIRSSFNRKISGGDKLSDYLNSLPVMYEYDLFIRGDVRKNIEKRTAHIALKWGKTTLLKPEKCKDKQASAGKEMYVVEAREANKTKGIYWRILTTHPVTGIEEALQIIEWYKHRW